MRPGFFFLSGEIGRVTLRKMEGHDQEETGWFPPLNVAHRAIFTGK
jgi:hypothetical protein